MYNDRRYSLTRCSLNRENRTVEIQESFSKVMNAVAGAAVPVDFQGRFTETVRIVVMGAVAVVSSFSALAELAAARPSANAVRRCRRIATNPPARRRGMDFFMPEKIWRN